MQDIDVNDSLALASAIQGYAIIVHAFAAPRTDSIDERIARQTAGTKSITETVKQAKIKRLVAVSGEGTADVALGLSLMQSYFFLPEYEGGARLTVVIKDLL